jgi:hypothetical protein
MRIVVALPVGAVARADATALPVVTTKRYR